MFDLWPLTPLNDWVEQSELPKRGVIIRTIWWLISPGKAFCWTCLTIFCHTSLVSKRILRGKPLYGGNPSGAGVSFIEQPMNSAEGTAVEGSAHLQSQLHLHCQPNLLLPAGKYLKRSPCWLPQDCQLTVTSSAPQIPSFLVSLVHSVVIASGRFAT